VSIATKEGKNALFPAAQAAYASDVPLPLCYSCVLFVNDYMFSEPSMACGAISAGEDRAHSGRHIHSIKTIQ